MAASDRTILIACLHYFLRNEDWHGVCDMANELRVLDEKMKCHG